MFSSLKKIHEYERSACFSHFLEAFISDAEKGKVGISFYKVEKVIFNYKNLKYNSDFPNIVDSQVVGMELKTGQIIHISIT